MSNEYKDWMRENRQDALLIIDKLDDVIDSLDELRSYDCSQQIIMQLMIAREALRDESK